MRVPEFQKEYDEALLNPPLCACGCGGKVVIKIRHAVFGVPKYRKGHHVVKRIYNSRIRKDRLLYEENKEYFCLCNCKAKIAIKESHKFEGVPKYLKGHFSKGRLLEESFGKEFAEIFLQRNKDFGITRKNKTYEEIYGVDTAKKLKKCRSIAWTGRPSPLKGRTYKEIHGEEKAAELSQKRRMTKRVFKATKPELILQEAIRLNITFNFETQKQIYGLPDIFIEPNICIFVDGDYYHAYPGKYKAETIFFKTKTAQQIWDKDKRVTDYLVNKGYVVLRFWEHDIHNNLEKCTNTIREYCDVQNSYLF
jgi:DNA mismatch endonuclease (patch repair protein)